MNATLQRAVGLMQAGRHADAIVLLDRVLAAQPDQADALQLRGMARGRLGLFEPGRADLNAAAARHPQPHAVWSNLGNLEQRAGQVDAAIAAYRRALDIAPDFADAAYNLAVCLADSGAPDDAAQAYEALLARHPGHVTGLNGLAVLRGRQDRNDEALSLYDEALRLRPDFSACRVNRAALLCQLGRAREALVDLDVAIREAPGLAEGYFFRGAALRTLGHLPEARAALDRAIALAPMRADFHRDYASLVWESGDSAATTARLDQVLVRQPDAELHLVRARILMRTGRAAEAAEAAAAAVRLAPDHAAARALRGELRSLMGERAVGLDDLQAAFRLSAGHDCAIRHQLVEALLAHGEPAAALDLLSDEPGPGDLQKHVALKALAWRSLDDDRYRQFYDYDRLTARIRIEAPDGYASLDAFNAALADSIQRLHRTSAQPVEQTLFGGTQSPGRLWDEDDSVIRALGPALLAAAHRFVGQLPDDPDHPFLRRRSNTLRLAGAWSVRLRSGGGHVDHIHPAGWISACYYVAVPDVVLDSERAGWLRLGASGVAGLPLPAERYLKPEAGVAIFFPSYMWHGVEPFHGDGVRVTAPFDILPV